MGLEYERGRRYGVKQAIEFLVKRLDQPTYAEDLKTYILNRKEGIPSWQEIRDS